LFSFQTAANQSASYNLQQSKQYTTPHATSNPDIFSRRSQQKKKLPPRILTLPDSGVVVIVVVVFVHDYISVYVQIVT
jgi:hypothetical protein